MKQMLTTFTVLLAVVLLFLLLWVGLPTLNG